MQFSTAEAIRIVLDSPASVSPQTPPTNKKLRAEICPVYQSSELFSGALLFPWLNPCPFFQKRFYKALEEVEKDVTIKVTYEFRPFHYAKYYDYPVEKDVRHVDTSGNHLTEGHCLSMLPHRAPNSQLRNTRMISSVEDPSADPADQPQIVAAAVRIQESAVLNQ